MYVADDVRTHLRRFLNHVYDFCSLFQLSFLHPTSFLAPSLKDNARPHLTEATPTILDALPIADAQEIQLAAKHG
jgi:hypothetical protein